MSGSLVIWEKYVRDRHRLVSEWVQSTLIETVVGVEQRKAEANAFADAASRAEKSGLPFGIRLECEPQNPGDPNAIKVFGYAEMKGWTGKAREAEWHIGYLSAELAAALQKDVISAGLPISAELLGIFEDGGALDFSLIVLAPKGFAPQAKNNKSGANGGAAEPVEEKVARLVKDKQYDAAINLLLDCCDAEEARRPQAEGGAAPWSYETLAKLFRKLKLREEEIAILRRYQTHLRAPGAASKKLIARLEKLLSA